MISAKLKTRSTKQSYRDLLVWQCSMDLTTAVYQLTRTFPREETFGLTSQLRRSAISIASNIAEGHGRLSAREFRRFLFIARGSNSELQTQLQVSVNLRLGDLQSTNKVQSLSEEVENMLFALLSKLRSGTSQ